MPSHSKPEPRWPALLAILAAAAILAAVPENLALGPRWLAITLIVALEIPTLIAHRRKWYATTHTLGYIVSALLTLFLLWSLALLIAAIPNHKIDPMALLRAAGALWLANIIIFAVWYWRLDAGGPIRRDLHGAHTEGAFLFPQMAMPALKKPWTPRFIDYLFQAFNTSTAFSPTDVPILSRWAKCLTMLQSLISLTILVILAARAVNIL